MLSQMIWRSLYRFPCRVIQHVFRMNHYSVGISDLLTEEELLMQSMVSKFANDEISPLVSKMDRQGFMERPLIDSLFKAGLMGIEVPVKFGGSELNFVSSVVAIEEIAKVDPSVSILVDIQNTLIVSLLKRFGTPDQQECWLPRLNTEIIGSFCLSEASAGSDAFAMQTVAKRDGTDFILSGSKMWISNSKEAGLFLIMANANPSAGYKGITTFIVPRDTPGLSIGENEKKLGLRASSTCQVNLDDVRVPKTAVLGELGLGYRYAIEMLNEGRTGIAAQMLGLAEGCFTHAVHYVRERKQFGSRVWDFQVNTSLISFHVYTHLFDSLTYL
ncbi:Long-chain specific acyl-CoA dehydrogenase mitochondrial [Paragonimus heterotremus]|uniref:Short/branched chain specific acyl-CoA dehydrogenase, mitochondrial n=1 Tax=Paragonimus heterotremus TaxID=100268 RepID=A0A8J4SYP7_9TREM|nr:Long-chain specific acyl-CoA dehydrogenase mitochondrial [Paragonimus heterotremus]